MVSKAAQQASQQGQQGKLASRASPAPAPTSRFRYSLMSSRKVLGVVYTCLQQNVHGCIECRLTLLQVSCMLPHAQAPLLLTWFSRHGTSSLHLPTDRLTDSPQRGQRSSLLHTCALPCGRP